VTPPGKIRFGLLVTGKAERTFLSQLFRALISSEGVGPVVVFEIAGKIEQLSPITSQRRTLTLVRSGKTLATRDQEVGLRALNYLRGDANRFVLLIDDLEHDRRPCVEQVYQRYRKGLDEVLGPLKSRAAVHFFVNMLEAYYFADSKALNAVLHLGIEDHDGDVEDIRHPKNDLAGMFAGFHPIEHGAQIVGNSTWNTCSATQAGVPPFARRSRGATE
jgi:hypothetical protein